MNVQMYQNAAFLAVFLLIYSAVAGRIERSLISGPIVFTVVGFILGRDGLGVLRINISGEGLRLLAELTLAMVLFTDAANADFGVVRSNLGLPERLLGVGLPLTILLGFVFAAIVFPSLGILEMALLAAILAPTDAALGKPVVTKPTVPPAMREALNLESGLNDGICVPIVVILLGLAVGTQIEGGTVGHVVWVVVEEIGIGALIGIALTWLTVRMLRFAERRGWISKNWVEIPIVALAAACFAAAQAAHRMLCRRALAERARRASQGGAVARRRTYGRGIGAADMGSIRRHRRRPDDRPRHLAGTALCSAQSDRDTYAAGLPVPDRHAHEHGRQALHRLVRPARAGDDRFCNPRPRRKAARQRHDHARGRLDGAAQRHRPRRDSEPSRQSDRNTSLSFRVTQKPM